MKTKGQRRDELYSSYFNGFCFGAKQPLIPRPKVIQFFTRDDALKAIELAVCNPSKIDGYHENILMWIMGRDAGLRYASQVKQLAKETYDFKIYPPHSLVFRIMKPMRSRGRLI